MNIWHLKIVWSITASVEFRHFSSGMKFLSLQGRNCTFWLLKTQFLKPSRGSVSLLQGGGGNAPPGYPWIQHWLQLHLIVWCCLKVFICFQVYLSILWKKEQENLLIGLVTTVVPLAAFSMEWTIIKVRRSLKSVVLKLFHHVHYLIQTVPLSYVQCLTGSML